MLLFWKVKFSQFLAIFSFFCSKIHKSFKSNAKFDMHYRHTMLGLILTLFKKIPTSFLGIQEKVRGCVILELPQGVTWQFFFKHIIYYKYDQINFELNNLKIQRKLVEKWPKPLSIIVDGQIPTFFKIQKSDLPKFLEFFFCSQISFYDP